MVSCNRSYRVSSLCTGCSACIHADTCVCSGLCACTRACVSVCMRCSAMQCSAVRVRVLAYLRACSVTWEINTRPVKQDCRECPKIAHELHMHIRSCASVPAHTLSLVLALAQAGGWSGWLGGVAPARPVGQMQRYRTLGVDDISEEGAVQHRVDPPYTDTVDQHPVSHTPTP